LLPADFANTSEALTFPAQIARLQAISGALDRMLAQATRRVDGFCKKRIVAPPTTTIATGGGINAGATSVNVTSTLGFDNGQETALQFNPGGDTEEIVPVVPGGIIFGFTSASYPGSIQLAQGTTYSHSAGEMVRGLYQEISTVGSASSAEPYANALDLNQDAQLAYAHTAPYAESGNLTRVIFLKHYPIVQLFQLEHQLPFAPGQYNSVGIANIGIHASAGYIRLPIGSYVLEFGLFRSTYTAGFANPSEEVQQATALYMADELQNMVTMGAAQSQQGKLKLVAGQPTQYKSRYVQSAEEILTNVNLVRKL